MGKLDIRPYDDIKLFRRTLAFIWESSKRLTIIRWSLILLQATLPLIPLYLIKLLIDELAINEERDLSDVLWILIAFGAVQLMLILINNLSQYITSIQGDEVADYMSSRVLEKSIELDLGHYDCDEYHDTYFKAQIQAGHRPISLLNSLTQLAQQSLILLALAGLLLTLHWAIALVMIVMVLPIAFVQLKYTRVIFKWKERTTPLERKTNYIRRVLSSIPFAKEVRQFAYGNTLKKRFSEIRRQLLSEKKQLYIRQNISLSLVQGIEAIATVAILSFIIYRAISGMITLGDIVMYFQAFQKGQSSIHGLLKSVVSLYENRLFLMHIFDFLNLPSKLRDRPDSFSLRENIQTIELENVSFSYPGTSLQALRDINLTLKHGQIIALVGENGSGKSTLVKLLTRLYDPTQGVIKINGNDIRSYKIADVRNKMAVIFQDFSKYDFTVKENIHISRMNDEVDNDEVDNDEVDNDEVDNDEIVNAAERARADGFINQLASGYDNQLGKAFAGGHELSGGQWQKIALARAFFKDSDVIILDEPTSQIDPLSEAEIFNEFRTFSEDRLCILVTHRIYNLKSSDEIIVLKDGQISELGSHQDLIKSEGDYAKMFSVQQ